MDSNEPTQGATASIHQSAYPKLVYALDDGRPIEGICNTPQELQQFTFSHSLVQACSYIEGIAVG